MSLNLIVDEYKKAFARREIHSKSDFYSGYNQFQLALQNKDLITMKTLLDLIRMCTLPQEATNLVAQIINKINKY